MRACINKNALLTNDYLKSTFALFTKNENKNISPLEFKTFLGLQSKFNDKQWEQIIKNVDKDGNGQVRIFYNPFNLFILFFCRLILGNLRK